MNDDNHDYDDDYDDGDDNDDQDDKDDYDDNNNDDDDVCHQATRRLLQPKEQGERGTPRWGGVKPPGGDDDYDDHDDGNDDYIVTHDYGDCVV